MVYLEDCNIANSCIISIIIIITDVNITNIVSDDKTITTETSYTRERS